MDRIPQLSDIKEAHERIREHIHRTPVLTSKQIDEITGCRIHFKCENLQKVGAFKFRGATNAVLQLSDDDVSKGAATHSSGNHAAALALAAKTRGVPAYIVMPRTAPEIKKKAVKGYGANIVFCEPTLEARETALNKVVEETGAVFVHPYNDYNIIAGQATAAKELIEDTDKLDYITAPVGGGGLISGTCLSTEYLSSNTKVIGGEPKGADDAYRSLRDGKIHPSVNPQTIADGLLTSLCEKTYGIINGYIDDIITVKEETIVQAMRDVWERMKIIIEPSAAVPLAVIYENKEMFAGKQVGVIFSGGNLDLEKLPWL